MYQIARNSTVRMILDTIEQYPELNLEYYDWDAHAEGEELPDADLVGLVGFACGEDNQFHDIAAGVGIVTLNDPGIYRLTKIIDIFYRRLRLQERYAVYDADGNEIGRAVCMDGQAVAPTSRVDVRPAQTVSFSARIQIGAE